MLLCPLQGWVMRQPAMARALSLIPQPAATQHAVMSRPDMLSEATAEGNLQPGDPVGVPLSPSAQTALPAQELVVSEEVQTLVAQAGDPHELLLKVSPAALRVNSFGSPLPCRDAGYCHHGAGRTAAPDCRGCGP